MTTTSRIVGAGAALACLERWTGRTRASREERRKPLPGDELVAGPMWQATRATTI